MRTCPSCHQTAPEQTSFCPACGAAFRTLAAAKQESTLLKWLRKLGVYRSGATAAVYHNAIERPIELQVNGVFDASKDLVTKQDFQKSPPPFPQKKP
jgi:hypothetical protein